MENIEIDDLEVLTSEGFKSFSGIKRSSKDKYFCIQFNDGTKLKCSYEHKIRMNTNFVYAHDLKINDVIDDKIIKSIDLIDDTIDVYDLLNVESTHHYITNGITSHNCAFVDNWDQFFTSVFPTISSGQDTKIILVSTPNGLNHFYKTWKLAEEGKNNYKYVKVHWSDVPGRDEKWKQEVLAGMNFDLEKFAQEHEVEFQGSSGTLISGWKLKELVGENPIMQSEGLYQYKKPIDNHSYVCIVDVSRGKGLDYSAFSIIDVTKMPYEQVCAYRNNSVTPLDYAGIIHTVCKSYNSASILVEINDIGEQVSTSLHYDYEYENILFTESAGRSGKRITSGFGATGTLDKGIRTTKIVKSIGCSILKLMVEQNQLIINDFNTINELSTFSRKGASYEAEVGCHDDLVMSLVLFAWLSDQSYFKEFTNINTLAKLREKSDEEIAGELLPFGFVDSGETYEEMLDSPRRSWLDLENDFL